MHTHYYTIQNIYREEEKAHNKGVHRWRLAETEAAEDDGGSRILSGRIRLCSRSPTTIGGDSRRDGRYHGEVGGVAEHVKETRQLAHMGIVLMECCWLWVVQGKANEAWAGRYHGWRGGVR